VITVKETMLNELTEDRLHFLIKAEADRDRKVMEKANEFLKDVIGEESFKELQQKGFFVFTALDGKEYRIKKDGLLQVGDGQYWCNCCYIEPSSLPLPDLIASVFNTVKNSERFAKETRTTRTDEEVMP